MLRRRLWERGRLARYGSGKEGMKSSRQRSRLPELEWIGTASGNAGVSPALVAKSMKRMA